MTFFCLSKHSTTAYSFNLYLSAVIAICKCVSEIHCVMTFCQCKDNRHALVMWPGAEKKRVFALKETLACSFLCVCVWIMQGEAAIWQLFGPAICFYSECLMAFTSKNGPFAGASWLFYFSPDFREIHSSCASYTHSS